MSMTLTRVVSAVVLFILTMIAGALPPVLFNMWRKRRRQRGNYCEDQTNRWLNYRNLMKILMFFGGGVLLATCFIHLLPEVRENMHHYMERKEDLEKAAEGPNNVSDRDHDDHDHHLMSTGFSTIDVDDGHDHDPSHEHGNGEQHHHHHSVPVVELSVCVGFFIIYLIEEIVHSFIGHHDHSGGGGGKDGRHGHGEENGPKEAPYACYTVANDSVEETSFRSTRCSNRTISSASGSSVSHGDGSRVNITAEGSVERRPKSVRFMQGLVVIIAFSAHSIFDGVAIGLQEEEGRLWTMFFAICSHKLVVALAVGMELFEKTESVAMTTIHMGLFASMSPIGIFIVITTESSLSEDSSPVIILLSAVATGTILYIVFFEILQRDHKDEEPRFFGILLYVCMLIGFAVMFCMTVYISHDE